MKRRKILKQITLIYILAIILTITNVGFVKASLQSNPNTNSKNLDTPENWMSKLRQMETAGETMGLSETLDSDLTATSESNGIDIHMLRSTEYGATAILSASAYGNSSNEQNMESTTGNDTGVILSLNPSVSEAVAGGIQGKIFSGTNEKYYDTYTKEPTSARVGDALGNDTTINPGCARWHQSLYNSWISDFHPYWCRGRQGIYSYLDSAPTSAFWCRGVAVCGDEL